MRSGNPGRAMHVDVLSRLLRRVMIIVFLLIVIADLAAPVRVLAYTEDMFELVVASNPPVIVQNQSYSTRTRQTLFHTATNAATDAEAFSFSGLPGAGVQLAQTSGFAGAGTETGYFTSTASSDIVPPVHIGNGYLGTWIGDPLWTRAPFFAGAILPQMTKASPVATTSRPIAAQPAVKPVPGTDNATADKTRKDTIAFQPVIDYDLNRSLSNESDNMALPANATRQNATAKNATVRPTATPSPAIKPGEPFYHQQNKPFSAALTSPSGPFKATPDKIRNTSGFDRFLMNTVGRSTTDKAFNGTTSSPAYITPGKALAVQIPYDFIQGARGMTMPGTRLNYRAWPL